MQQHAGLDGLDGCRAGHGRLGNDRGPGRAEVTSEFKVHPPSVTAVIGFTAARAHEGAVWQAHGFIFHRAENAVREADCLPPCQTGVVAATQHSPPRARAGADFIKEQQRAIRLLPEDRIPAGQPRPVSLHPRRDLLRGRPPCFLQPGQPDAHRWVFFLQTAKPRALQPTRRLHQRRGVTLRKWRFLVDKFPLHQPRLVQRNICRAPAGTE